MSTIHVVPVGDLPDHATDATDGSDCPCGLTTEPVHREDTVTTVVAAAQAGRIVMAADTLNNVYDRPIIGAARKICRVEAGDTEALIGICGNGAMGSLIRRDLQLHTPDTTNLQSWADAVALAITGIYTAHSLLTDGRQDGTLILGCHGQLWTLTDAQAIPHADGRAALGSGEGPAIGAVDALLDSGVDLRTAVEAAVHIGIARDKHSSGPAQVEELRLTGARP